MVLLSKVGRIVVMQLFGIFGHCARASIKSTTYLDLAILLCS